MLIAHVQKDHNGDWLEPHALEEHGVAVANKARHFAQGFGECAAYYMGIYHDLGKCRPAFQQRIRDVSGFEREESHVEGAGRVTHSTAGALQAIHDLKSFGVCLAYGIAGHHAGLPDWYGEQTGQSCLAFRLKQAEQEYQEALAYAPVLTSKVPELREFAPPFPLQAASLHIWIRMLFSCLVDADYLDTEQYMSPAQYAKRAQYPQLEELQGRYLAFMHSLHQNAPESPMNTLRQQVWQTCWETASAKHPIFSLTVPTGGGKTLASLGFALRHACLWQKQRIIYAIPYTSIIEQNAQVFRACLGNDALVEHHSNLDVHETEAQSRALLATENWDAPVIMTTNVQLFESLFASKSSRCRKLHHIANSVIILDEAQQLPRELHAPITAMMTELSKNYGVTWVLCTATQPVLTQSTDAFGKVLLEGLNDVQEMMSNPLDLFTALQRVQVSLPRATDPPLSWEELAILMAAEPRVLTIVNTRKQARTLFELLPQDDASFHLSASMCAQHRTEVLSEIKRRLATPGTAVRVVSTQLVEAGVDIDFPVVYRAMAGLDSIAQAAGRCNREGKLSSSHGPAMGRCVVFRAPENAPPGSLLQGQQVMEELIGLGLENPLTPEACEQYFIRYNAKASRDKQELAILLTAPLSGDAPFALQFKTAAQRFRMIANHGEDVIVPYISLLNKADLQESPAQESPVELWLNVLEKDKGARWVYRKLQRYTVQVPEHLFLSMQQEGALQLRAGHFVLVPSRYDAKLGLLPPQTLLDASTSVL